MRDEWTTPKNSMRDATYVIYSEHIYTLFASVENLKFPVRKKRRHFLRNLLEDINQKINMQYKLMCN